MVNRVLVAVVAGAATLSLAAPAGAATSTFSGTCDLGGTADFERGVTFEVRERTARMNLSGACRGTADGESLSGATGTLVAAVTGPVGCTGSTRSMRGEGTLSINRRPPLSTVRIPVTALLDVRTPNGTLMLRGADGGSARGDGTFLTRTDPGQMARCPSQGLDRVGFEADVRTSQALRAVTPDPVQGTSTPARRLRLAFRARQSSATVLRRGGVRVRCGADAAGRCTVTVRRGSTILARGSTRVTRGSSRVVLARLTAAGRRVLRSSRSVSATVRATGPGRTGSRRITFTR